MNEKTEANGFSHIELSNYLEFQNRIRKQAHEDKEMGFDWELEKFINFMRILPPHNYGTRIQNRLIKRLNFQKVKRSENLGDCRDNFNDPYEIKVSIIDGVNMHLNVVNVREWQNVHYYIVAFDVRNNFKCHFFRLSRNEMKFELDKLTTSSSLGTIESNSENKNVEKRFSIEINSDDFKRWVEKYSSKASELI